MDRQNNNQHRLSFIRFVRLIENKSKLIFSFPLTLQLTIEFKLTLEQNKTGN